MAQLQAGATVALETTGGHVTVQAGVIDFAAEHAYRHGQCLALALAFNEAHGWPLVAHLSRPGDVRWEQITHAAPAQVVLDDPGWFYDIVHVLAQHPNGDLVDIFGAHDPEGYRDEAMVSYGTAALTVLPAAPLVEGFTTFGLTQDLDCAALFATTLYERLCTPT